MTFTIALWLYFMLCVAGVGFLAYRLSNGGDTWRIPMARNDFINDGCSCVADESCDNCGISVCAWCVSEYECADCGWVLCQRCKTEHICEDDE